MDYRILQIFNFYLMPGGEAASVSRIYNTLQDLLPIESCYFNSQSWMDQGHPPTALMPFLMLYNPSSIKTLRQRQAETKSNLWLVHNVFPVASGGVYREALRQGVPVIYYIHNFRPFSVNGTCWVDNHIEPAALRGNLWPEIRAGAWRDSKVQTAIYAGVLSLMHRLGWFKAIKTWVAISEFMRQKFIEAGVPEADIFTLPHFWIPGARPEECSDEGYYLFLGRLVPEKGIDTLVRTWDLLLREMGPHTPLLRLCGAGPMESFVREAAEKNPKIKFMGEVKGNAKDTLLRRARAMVIPSVWWEPLGLVTYEAYDYGKPVFAAASGGLSETVQEGATGWLHTPGQAEELAGQITKFESSPAHGREMGRAGREWLLANTRKEDWVDQIQMILRRTLEA